MTQWLLFLHCDNYFFMRKLLRKTSCTWCNRILIKHELFLFIYFSFISLKLKIYFCY